MGCLKMVLSREQIQLLRDNQSAIEYVKGILKGDVSGILTEGIKPSFLKQLDTSARKMVSPGMGGELSEIVIYSQANANTAQFLHHYLEGKAEIKINDYTGHLHAVDGELKHVNGKWGYIQTIQIENLNELKNLNNLRKLKTKGYAALDPDIYL